MPTNKELMQLRNSLTKLEAINIREKKIKEEHESTIKALRSKISNYDLELAAQRKNVIDAQQDVLKKKQLESKVEQLTLEINLLKDDNQALKKYNENTISSAKDSISKWKNSNNCLTNENEKIKAKNNELNLIYNTLTIENQKHKNQLSNYEDDIKELKMEITELSNRLKQKDAENHSLENKYKLLNNKIAERDNSIHLLQIDIKKLDELISEKDFNITRVKNENIKGMEKTNEIIAANKIKFDKLSSEYTNSIQSIEEKTILIENSKIKETEMKEEISMLNDEIRRHLCDKEIQLNQLNETKNKLLSNETKLVLITENLNKAQNHNKTLNKNIIELKNEISNQIEKYNNFVNEKVSNEFQLERIISNTKECLNQEKEYVTRLKERILELEESMNKFQNQNNSLHEINGKIKMKMQTLKLTRTISESYLDEFSDNKMIAFLEIIDNELCYLRKNIEENKNIAQNNKIELDNCTKQNMFLLNTLEILLSREMNIDEIYSKKYFIIMNFLEKYHRNEIIFSKTLKNSENELIILNKNLGNELLISKNTLENIENHLNQYKKENENLSLEKVKYKNDLFTFKQDQINLIEKIDMLKEEINKKDKTINEIQSLSQEYQIIKNENANLMIKQNIIHNQILKLENKIKVNEESYARISLENSYLEELLLKLFQYSLFDIKILNELQNNNLKKQLKVTSDALQNALYQQKTIKTDITNQFSGQIDILEKSKENYQVKYNNMIGHIAKMNEKNENTIQELNEYIKDRDALKEQLRVVSEKNKNTNQVLEAKESKIDNLNYKLITIHSKMDKERKRCEQYKEAYKIVLQKLESLVDTRNLENQSADNEIKRLLEEQNKLKETLSSYEKTEILKTGDRNDFSKLTPPKF